MTFPINTVQLYSVNTCRIRTRNLLFYQSKQATMAYLRLQFQYFFDHGMLFNLSHHPQDIVFSINIETSHYSRVTSILQYILTNIANNIFLLVKNVNFQYIISCQKLFDRPMFKGGNCYFINIKLACFCHLGHH